MKSAALLYGDREHYLDHLAPLSALFGMPLVVNEISIFELAKRFYPGIELLYKDYLEVHPFVVQNFDLVFYCFLKGDFEDNFGLQKRILGKEVHTVWCPHGNSDKGWHLYFMEALSEEDHALVYGDRMLDFIRRKNVHRPAFYKVGNYRLQYYLKYKDLLDGHIKERLKQKRGVDILYAPTWQDCEDNCSFWEVFPHLAKKLPSGWRLIVKLHPNTCGMEGMRVENIMEKYAAREDIIFLSGVPLIYPLLNYVDVYIGDMSSIGYDFLYFNKPMFFLSKKKRQEVQDPAFFLHHCGIEIKKEDYSTIYKKIEKNILVDGGFSKTRKKVFDYTFEEKVDLSEIASQVKMKLGLPS